MATAFLFALVLALILLSFSSSSLVGSQFPLPTSLAEQPSDSAVPAGSSAQFRCRPSGPGSPPRPSSPLVRFRISWLHDGRPIRRGRRIRFAADRTTVYIKNVRKEASTMSGDIWNKASR